MGLLISVDTLVHKYNSKNDSEIADDDDNPDLGDFWLWPRVDEHEWCGEFKKSKEAKSAIPDPPR